MLWREILPTTLRDKPQVIAVSKRRFRTALVSGAVAAAVFLSACSEADQVSKKILFSPLNATVTNLGVPVAGALVTRSYEWRSSGQKAADTALTDPSGKFSLPLMTGSSLSTTWLPH